MIPQAVSYGTIGTVLFPFVRDSRFFAFLAFGRPVTPTRCRNLTMCSESDTVAAQHIDA
jgi:hypothetical protein